MPKKFLTTNPKKIASARALFGRFGIALDHVNDSVDEIQADDISAVCAAKLEAAQRMHGGDVIVEDGGLFIDALDGFPGPFTFYVVERIGCRGIVELMAGRSCRTARVGSAAGHVDAVGVTTFTRSDGPVLEIAERVPDEIASDGWSDLWGILIPPGQTTAYALLSEEDRAVFSEVSQRDSALHRMAEAIADAGARS